MTQQCLVKAERLGVKDWKSSQEVHIFCMFVNEVNSASGQTP